MTKFLSDGELIEHFEVDERLINNITKLHIDASQLDEAACKEKLTAKQAIWFAHKHTGLVRYLAFKYLSENLKEK